MQSNRNYWSTHLSSAGQSCRWLQIYRQLSLKNAWAALLCTIRGRPLLVIKSSSSEVIWQATVNDQTYFELKMNYRHNKLKYERVAFRDCKVSRNTAEVPPSFFLHSVCRGNQTSCLRFLLTCFNHQNAWYPFKLQVITNSAFLKLVRVIFWN